MAGRALQSGGRIDGVSGCGRMQRAMGGDHNLSRLDAYSDRESDPSIPLDLLVQRLQGPAQLDCGPHRPQRVILMGDGDAEQANQHVADQFLDGRTVAPEHAGGQVDGAHDDPPMGFRVRTIAGAVGDSKINEHDRDGPPLSREPGLRRSEARNGVAWLPDCQGRLPGRLQVQRGILPKDRALELPKPRSGLDPQLLGQRLAGVPVDRKGLGLSPGTIQRHHQLASQALSERVLGDQRLQLRHQLTVAPERQVGLDPLLDRHQPELLQGGDLPLGEGLVGELGQGRPAPQAQRPAKARRPLGRRGPARLLEQAPEQVRIDAGRVDRQDVAGRDRSEDGSSLASDSGRLQALAEGGHQTLECRGRRWRRALAPQLVDEPVRRDDLAGVQDQEREKRSPSPTRQGHRSTLVEDLQRPQDPELHPSLPDPPLTVPRAFAPFLLRRVAAPLAFL